MFWQLCLSVCLALPALATGGPSVVDDYVDTDNKVSHIDVLANDTSGRRKPGPGHAAHRLQSIARRGDRHRLRLAPHQVHSVWNRPRRRYLHIRDLRLGRVVRYRHRHGQLCGRGPDDHDHHSALDYDDNEFHRSHHHIHGPDDPYHHRYRHDLA